MTDMEIFYKEECDKLRVENAIKQRIINEQNHKIEELTRPRVMPSMFKSANKKENNNG